MKQSRRIKIKIHEGSEEKCIQCQQKITDGSKIVEIEADAETEINKFYKPGKYHLLCLAIQKYFIAFIDILGFSKLTLELPLRRIYEIIEQFFATARSSRVEASIGRETRPIADIPYIVLSDSIILYQIVKPPLDVKDFLEWKETIFSQFLTSLESIFQEAFKRNLHLRGGVSYGECYISPESGEDSIKIEHILIGRPFTEAVKMEGLQSWMGVAFHPSMSEYLEKSTLKESLIEYKIPLKDNSCTKEFPKYTIAWVDASMETHRKRFDQWQTENPRQEKIKSNTIKYFEEYITRNPPLRHIGSIVLNPDHD